MVFIGIVTSSMIKNAASQSTAAAGYGSMQVMHSTAVSAGIATESYFLNPANSDSMLKKVNHSSISEPYIYGKATEKKQMSQGQQYFSTRLVKFDTLNYHSANDFRSRIEINSGKNAGGRNMGKVQMYAYLGNLKLEHEELPPPPSIGQNALYTEGNMTPKGDVELVVNGPATIMGNASLARLATFRGSTYIGGTVSADGSARTIFEDEVYIHGAATFANRLIVGGDGYFNDDLTFMGGAVVPDFVTGFRKKAHITGNLKVTNLGNSSVPNPLFGDQLYIRGTLDGDQNSAFNVAGNVHLGGNFLSPMRLTGHGGNRTLNHAGAATNINGIQSSFNRVSVTTNVINSTDILPGLRGRMTGDNLAARKDPPITISNICDTVGLIWNTTLNGQTFMTNLRAAYTNAANKKHFFDGHLVIRVRARMNFTTNSDPGSFDGKVIFILESGGVFEGRGFYNGSNSSSTLIYAGSGNCGLNDFALFSSAGHFRGLIYIDRTNTYPEHIISAIPNLHGAVHNHSSRTICWADNSNANSRVTRVNYDGNALGAFSKLFAPGKPGKCEGGDDEDKDKNNDGGGSGGGGEGVLKLVFKDSTGVGTLIKIKPFGYYFH